MAIALSSDLEAFVRDRVASGQYPNEAEVVRAAFALLERRERLLAHIDEGTEQLRRGEYTEYADNQRREFVAAIKAASRQLEQPGQLT